LQCKKGAIENMAEQGKFAGSRDLKQPREVSVARPQPERTEQTAPVAIAPGRGRRAGKRSDPTFRPTTFFVRKETQRKAARLLEDQDAGKDLSDLVEELLAKWVVENSQA
jgi:hypothetical protein